MNIKNRKPKPKVGLDCQAHKWLTIRVEWAGPPSSALSAAYLLGPSLCQCYLIGVMPNTHTDCSKVSTLSKGFIRSQWNRCISSGVLGYGQDFGYQRTLSF